MRSILRLDRRQVRVYGNLDGAIRGRDRASERLGLFAPDGPETKDENRGSGFARVINDYLFMETRYSGCGSRHEETHSRKVGISRCSPETIFRRCRRSINRPLTSRHFLSLSLECNER